MPSKAMNEATKREWRDLGFFYDRDDAAKVWTLTGSRTGLSGFADLLRSYASDIRHETVSEHEHYGPYLYLEVMTSPGAGFDGHAIRGPLSELNRLASLIEQKLAAALPGTVVEIREEFAVNSPYALVLNIQGDGFDPATADPALVDTPANA